MLFDWSEAVDFTVTDKTVIILEKRLHSGFSWVHNCQSVEAKVGVASYFDKT